MLKKQFIIATLVAITTLGGAMLPCVFQRSAAAEPIKSKLKKGAYLLEGANFTSISYGFSVPIPMGWGPEPLDLPGVPLRMTRSSSQASAIFWASPVAENERDLVLGSADLEKMAQRNFRGFRVVSNQSVQLDGQPFQQFDATGSAGAKHYKVYVGRYQQTQFIIWLAAGREGFAQADKEFTQSIHQIQFQPVLPQETDKKEGSS